MYQVFVKLQLNVVFSGGLNTQSHELELIVNQLKLNTTLDSQSLSFISRLHVELNIAHVELKLFHFNNIDHVFDKSQDRDNISKDFAVLNFFITDKAQE
ncbi:hypothetical protein HOF65_07425 [bacterium]|nr:hypothetical protein [bacterium]MBT3853744.1 hypothetical protein [bacterium]